MNPALPASAFDAFPLDSVRAISPVLREFADRADRESRLADEVTSALRGSGVFRTGVPRAFGGLELSPRAFLTVATEVAESCPSSAWIAVTSYSSQHIAAAFPDRVRRDLWADGPDFAMCGSFYGHDLRARRIDGGQLVSGRWPTASGCHHADWAVLAIPVVDDSGVTTDQGIALVPLNAMTIDRTWNMAGMRGTGSDTVVADELFIPDHRVRRFTDVLASRGHASEPLYHIPLGSMALMAVGPLLGAARSAFQQVMQVVDSGKPMATSFYPRLAESPSVQANLAEARHLLDTAELHLYRSADAIMANAQAGTTPTLLDRTRVRMDAGHATRSLTSAVHLLMTVNGASSFAQDKQLQRYWRDIETAARHPTLNEGLSREMYGRALVGITDPVSPLV